MLLPLLRTGWTTRAAAVAEARNPAQAWALLESIPAEVVRNCQPYWAQAAHLLRKMQRAEESVAAYERAIGLCEDVAMRAFLQEQMAEMR